MHRNYLLRRARTTRESENELKMSYNDEATEEKVRQRPLLRVLCSDKMATSGYYYDGYYHLMIHLVSNYRIHDLIDILPSSLSLFLSCSQFSLITFHVDRRGHAVLVYIIGIAFYVHFPRNLHLNKKLLFFFYKLDKDVRTIRIR